MKQEQFSTLFALQDALIGGSFWKRLQEVVRTQMLPFQWKALNDEVPDAPPSYCMRNFKAAAGITQDTFHGCVFQDSDFAKWIEAVGYALAWHPDPKLEGIADGAIDILVAAQQPDGYMNTYYILNGLENRWTNIMDHHELYCAGHLIEAAIAYYQATGKDKLLAAVRRLADNIGEVFGAQPGKIHGYPGHEVLELALVRLYELTREERYLNLARYFIDERGQEPLFFADEIKRNGNHYQWEQSAFQLQYYQAGKPVREQKDAEGHAVRAVYLYAGMADVARETGDETLHDACRCLWDSMVHRRMYITGGIGSASYGESFGDDYDLPNRSVYAETCAAIGLVFFARRMLQIQACGEYGDVMERALYNGVLSGMSMDGTHFFYVNPLEVQPAACETDSLCRHVKPTRQQWFGCACCPPNLARLIASLGSYVSTRNADGVFLHLFIEGVYGSLERGELAFRVETAYPWDGRVNITVLSAPKSAKSFAVRIPGWCRTYTLSVCGGAGTADIRQGYATMTRTWVPGETILLNLDMPAEIMQANPLVREDLGKVALMRGPMVYCLEETDNGADLHRAYVDPQAPFVPQFEKEMLGGVVTLTSPGFQLEDSTWDENVLYRRAQPDHFAEKTLKWIPYYAWANRDVGEMTVWVHARQK